MSGARKNDPAELAALIRSIPDHPKPGILFRDVTPLLLDGPGFRRAIESLIRHADAVKPDKIAGIEARGLIFGAAVAHAAGYGFIPVRKEGKLPGTIVSESYELEYGTDTLEMHADAVRPGERILIVDDLLATGGTARAAVRLLRGCGAEVAHCSFVIELGGLPGRGLLEEDGIEIHALLAFEEG